MMHVDHIMTVSVGTRFVIDDDALGGSFGDVEVMIFRGYDEDDAGLLFDDSDGDTWCFPLVDDDGDVVTHLPFSLEC
jgi:hypothetical protein